MNWQNLNKPNVGLLFNKSIYLEYDIRQKIVHEGDELKFSKDIEQSDFHAYYETIYNQRVADVTHIHHPNIETAFSAYVSPPGLVIGSGYAHDTKAKGDFKIGFSFDYTTGQAIVPGSSIKGVCKTMFSSKENFAFILGEIGEKENSGKWAAKTKEISENELKHLSKSIFGDDADEDGAVVFYDAVINPKQSKAQKLYSNDFITPHEPYLLRNPTPLMFLKIRANVAFDFRFGLDKFNTEQLSHEELKEVLKTIILTLGLGAKTNVGYGQFSLEPITSTSLPESNNHHRAQPQGTPVHEELINEEVTEEIVAQLVVNKTYEGEIVKIDKKRVYYQFSIDGCPLTFTKNLKKWKWDNPEVGEKVIVTFLNTTPPTVDNYTSEATNRVSQA